MATCPIYNVLTEPFTRSKYETEHSIMQQNSLPKELVEDLALLQEQDIQVLKSIHKQRPLHKLGIPFCF